MNIGSINYNNPSFSAKWSKGTMDMAERYDFYHFTNYKQELEDALNSNKALREFGGDSIELSLGQHKSEDVPCEFETALFYSVELSQKIPNSTKYLQATLPPKSKNPEYVRKEKRLSEFEILERMDKDEDIKKQILDTVAHTKRDLESLFIENLEYGLGTTIECVLDDKTRTKVQKAIYKTIFKKSKNDSQTN